jgi:ring-1,2-phenylacetyl-CoA epoxidase subunit PaaB
MDTQWPKYIVFDQPNEGKPAFYAGSVHAPDSEMALLNARDVFGRRDEHNQLWVVPENQIFSRTLQELTTQPSADVSLSEEEAFIVFQKTSHKGTLFQIGEVQANHPQEAMGKALETYSNPKAIVWWVVPARAIRYSDPSENDSLFGPAHEKPFRHSNFYPTVTLMREINLANEKLNWEDGEQAISHAESQNTEIGDDVH